MQTKRLKSMRIQTRLMLYLITVIIIVSCIGDTVLYFQNTNTLMSDLTEKVCNLSASASLLIDGDMLKRVEASGDMSNEEYIRIRDQLREFQQLTGVTYIYTLSKNGDNQTKFIVDADLDEPGLIGDSYDYFDGMTEAFLGSPSANESVYTDEWDTLLSGYSPIKDSDGNVVAIVAVDISANQIHASQMVFLTNFLLKLFITLLLMTIMILLICKRINRPIHLLEAKLRELSTSGGDLTQRIEIHSGDEIESLGNSINEFIANIRDIIKRASDISEQVNIGASSLEDSITNSTYVLENNTIAIQAIASGAVNQVNDIDTVTNGVIYMSKEFNESYKQIDSINETINLSEKHINTGTEMIKDLNTKTDHNLRAFSDVYTKIENLLFDVTKINEILQSISYISQQINLLSLNASIEAARAGEEGKGFSVVANEIKQLATKTAQSVQEVDKIINKVFDDTDEVKSHIDIVTMTFEKQKSSVEDTEEAFHGIQENVSTMIAGVNFINSTLKNVDTLISEISSSMNTICDVSQENASLTEELSASSEEQSATMYEIETTAKNLKLLCQEMDYTIEKFIL